MPKTPKKLSRPKAGKPELKPLGEHLAALLNPALTGGPPIGFAEAPATFDGGAIGVAATTASLKDLLERGDPNLRDKAPWTPHRPPRPEKSEGGVKFKLVSEYAPRGDQPAAIDELVARHQRQ